MPKILLKGGDGFIGIHLALLLLAKGFQNLHFRFLS